VRLPGGQRSGPKISDGNSRNLRRAQFSGGRRYPSEYGTAQARRRRQVIDGQLQRPLVGLLCRRRPGGSSRSLPCAELSRLIGCGGKLELVIGRLRRCRRGCHGRGRSSTGLQSNSPSSATGSGETGAPRASPARSSNEVGGRPSLLPIAGQPITWPSISPEGGLDNRPIAIMERWRDTRGVAGREEPDEPRLGGDCFCCRPVFGGLAIWLLIRGRLRETAGRARAGQECFAGDHGPLADRVKRPGRGEQTSARVPQLERALPSAT